MEYDMLVGYISKIIYSLFVNRLINSLIRLKISINNYIKVQKTRRQHEDLSAHNTDHDF